MLADLRDVSIILVAIMSLVIGAFLGVLIVQLSRLIKLLREEILPILTAAQETVTTVSGATTFVSDHVVQPAIRLASLTAGVRGAADALVGIRLLAGRGGASKTAARKPGDAPRN
jgi:hypothetical protein